MHAANSCKQWADKTASLLYSSPWIWPNADICPKYLWNSHVARLRETNVQLRILDNTPMWAITSFRIRCWALAALITVVSFLNYLKFAIECEAGWLLTSVYCCVNWESYHLASTCWYPSWSFVGNLCSSSLAALSVILVARNEVDKTMW